MTEPLTIQCPKCKAKLRLKSQAAIGKSLPCPKCRHTFVVKPLTEAEEELPVLSEHDLVPEDQALPPDQDWLKQFSGSALPPLASHAPLPSFNPARKKSANWQTPALIAGGGLLGVVLLVGVIWLVVSNLSGPAVASRPVAAAVDVPKAPARNGLDLAYLPPGAEIIVSLRVADCIKAPVLQSLLGNPELQQSINDLRKNVGLGPADVHSLTIGVAGVSERAKQLAQKQQPQVSGLALPWAEVGALPSIVVLRTSSPIDQRRILDYVAKLGGAPMDDIKSLSHQGKSYYRIDFRGSQRLQSAAVYFANDKTAVMGTEQDVKSAITRGDSAEVRPDLDFVDVSQHLVFATAGKDAASISLPTGAPADQGSELQKALRESAKAVSFGVTLNEAIAFQVQLACADAAGAAKLKSQFDAALDQQLAKYRQSMAQTKQQFEQLAALSQAPPPVFVEVLDLLEAIFSSVQSQTSGGTVVVRASAPDSAGSTLAKLPQAISDSFSQGPPAAPNPGAKSPAY